VRWKTSCDCVPVDEVVQEGVDVVWAQVLVVQVVGVFPHIHSKKWHMAFFGERVSSSNSLSDLYERK
jgi:hypothetical protein